MDLSEVGRTVALLVVLAINPSCDSSVTSEQFDAEVTGVSEAAFEGSTLCTTDTQARSGFTRLALSMTDGERNIGIDGLFEANGPTLGRYPIVEDALALEQGQASAVYSEFLNPEFDIVRGFQADSGSLAISRNSRGVIAGSFEFRASGSFGTVGSDRQVMVRGTFTSACERRVQGRSTLLDGGDLPDRHAEYRSVASTSR